MNQPDTRVQDIQINAGRLMLAAREWGGEGGQRVLALHGWLDNAASFDPLLSQLLSFSGRASSQNSQTFSNEYHVVALDLPGHGWSQHRPVGENYHLLENLVDVIAAMDELGWDDCILLGHSLGGALAMLVAAAFPERVSALILIDALGPMVNTDDDVPGQIRKAVERQRKGQSKPPVYASLEDVVAARQRGVGTLSAESAALIAQRNLQKAADGFVWRTDARLRWPSLQRMSEGQVRAALAKIVCPSLLIAGTEGFIKSHHNIVKERLAQIQNLQIEYVEGGHHLHMEPAPAKVASVIGAFLNELNGT